MASAVEAHHAGGPGRPAGSHAAFPPGDAGRSTPSPPADHESGVVQAPAALLAGAAAGGQRWQPDAHPLPQRHAYAPSSGSGYYAPRAAAAAGSYEFGASDAPRPVADVNLSFVIENPREHVTLLDELLERNTRVVPVPPELPPLPEITRKDFASYVSQLRVARVRGGLSAEEMSTDFLDAAFLRSASGGGGGGGAHSTPGRPGGGAGSSPSTAAGHRRGGAGGTESPASSPSTDAAAALAAWLGAEAGAIASKEGAITAIDGAGYIDAFRAVPTEFFAPSFDITRKDGFDRLMELAGAEAEGGGGGGRAARSRAGSAAAAASAPSGSAAAAGMDGVQERLTTYLDIVECQLLALIKARSEQFFGALRDLQELQARITTANKVATALQRRLAAIRREAAVQPLYVVHAARRRARGAELKGVLTVLRDADRATGAVGRLVSGSDLMGALDLIASTRATLAARLAGVDAAGGLRRRLDEYERLVGDTLVGSWASLSVGLAVVGPQAVPGADGSGSGSSADGGLASPAALSPHKSTSRDGAGAGGFFSPLRAAPPLSFDAFLSGSMVPAAPGTPGATAAAASSEQAAAPGRKQQQPAPLDAAAAEAALEAALSGTVWTTLEGLVRTGRLGDGLEAFQGAFTRELKALLRSEVAEALTSAETACGLLPPPSSGGDGGPGDASPERVAALPPQGFLRVLTSVCGSLREVLGRVYGLHEAVERVLDTFRSRPGAVEMQAAVAAVAAAAGGSSGADAATTASSGTPSSQPQQQPPARSDAAWLSEVSRLRALSSGVLAVAVDAAQRHVARLLALRRPVAATLRVGDARALWEVGAAYAAAFGGLLAHAGGGGGSASSSSSAPATQQPLASSPILEECLSQSRSLLANAHGRNMAALAAMLDGEQWRQADVPAQVQAVAGAVAASGSAYGASGVQAAAAAAEGVSRPTHTADDNPAGELAAGVGRVLVVKGTGYALVGTGVMLVKMLGEYASLAEAIPDTAPEVVRAVVELLRCFNGRSTELVLGAKAMASAGLKRITAKHLALTSQTLGAVLALLPPLRASLIMRLPPSQHVLLAELARVTADYMAHEQAILSKFVAIVKDLLVKCVGDMRALPWGAPGTPLPVPTPPMRELCKGVATLHRILAPVLRPEQLLDVFMRVTVMVGSQVPVQYTALLAHLTDASVVAVAAYHEALSAARAAGTDGAASAALEPPSRFSREVANERLAADVRVLVTTTTNLLTACRELVGGAKPAAAAASDSGQPSHTAAGAASAAAAASLLAEAEAGMASGLAALHSLTTWTERQFGASSIVAEVAPPTEAPAAAVVAPAPASGGSIPPSPTASTAAAEPPAAATDEASAAAVSIPAPVRPTQAFGSPPGALPLLRLATTGDDLVLASAAAGAAAATAAGGDATPEVAVVSAAQAPPPAAASARSVDAAGDGSGSNLEFTAEAELPPPSRPSRAARGSGASTPSTDDDGGGDGGNASAAVRVVTDVTASGDGGLGLPTDDGVVPGGGGGSSEYALPPQLPGGSPTAPSPDSGSSGGGRE